MHCSSENGFLVIRLTEADLARPVELYGAFEDFIRDGERRITVDLCEVRMLTSLMIGSLVSLHLLAYENVVMLGFRGMHEKILALFRMVGVDRLMESHYAPSGRPGIEGANA